VLRSETITSAIEVQILLHGTILRWSHRWTGRRQTELGQGCSGHRLAATQRRQGPDVREEHGSGTGSVVPYRTRTRRHRTCPGTGSDDPGRPRVLSKPGRWTNTAGLAPIGASSRLRSVVDAVNDGDSWAIGPHVHAPALSVAENERRAIRARRRLPAIGRDEYGARLECRPVRGLR
jgi:hypothetical protein